MVDLPEKKAFIIEDDKDICTLLSIYLQNQNIRVVKAYTLASAKSIVLQQTPSVIFLDHRLPDGYGFEYIGELKQKYPETPIIAMTAQHTPATRELILKEGITYYLEKPFKISELKVLINTINSSNF